jgi:hypothetical protein
VLGQPERPAFEVGQRQPGGGAVLPADQAGLALGGGGARRGRAGERDRAGERRGEATAARRRPAARPDRVAQALISRAVIV